MVLALELDPAATGPYRVTLMDTAGERRWQGEGLLPDPFATLVLGFHSRLLLPGDYVLRLEEEAADGPLPVVHYSFRVRGSGDGSGEVSCRRKKSEIAGAAATESG